MSKPKEDAYTRENLHQDIWKIADSVRGSIDGWDFKHYILGSLFYRFISEHFINYIEAGDTSIQYAKMKDSDITKDVQIDCVKTTGYFIQPSDLFVNVLSSIDSNDDLNVNLKGIFERIELSAKGYPSESDLKGLFADFDTTSTRLGNTVKDKNKCLKAVLKGVDSMKFNEFSENEDDIFGDAYEFIIGNYAANAGKSGGEFFTPKNVSKLISKLAVHKQEKINKVYDPACGSGSLLLQTKNHVGNRQISNGYFGQEINHTTYNLARMNMFLHNINYDKFNIMLGDTLTEPHFGDDKPFDAIVSNPPYSIDWVGDADPTLINDERFSAAGVLAPKSKADFAFILHALHYLSPKGRAAIVCFSGIFYRGGAEAKIRKYLVENNYVESVIALAPNLFYGTSIAVCILVLAKNKSNNTDIQFIDASGEEFFKKVTNNNEMLDEHIKKVVDIFDRKDNVEHVSIRVKKEIIAANDYNLSVSSYVEAKDEREVINIQELNTEIQQTVAKISTLRSEIDELIQGLDA